ncbi:MAG: hypothetical protein F6K23_01715 [Okeania sp. SIO2C9]|uniref:hypothetical protein n=1 Tax=Okeania sp. SIO2C9 TaxID=2607791 RepID=UPI0013BF485A|nr:hypothetical protein [Okeania sp. SIO2C9]NEQ71907.1 hypothetical protein [Okeania sp. SIO2C9]
MWLTHLKPPSVGANGIRPPYKSFDFDYVLNSFETTICRGKWYSPSLQRFLILIMWLTHLIQINTFDCLECVLHSEETSKLRTRFCTGEWPFAPTDF